MEGQVTRASLGRVAFIGELYDARREAFSSRSLLKSDFPGEWIRRQNVDRMDFDYRFTENVSERFELLDVKGEAGVGVLLGLISVGGCGSFLTEESKSERTVVCSLACKIKTVCEKFIAPFADVLPYLDLRALEDPEYTHFVTEVSWGANCILSLAATCKEESTRKEVKGKLHSKLSMLKLQLSAKGGGEKKESSSANNEEIQIKVNSDLAPDGPWPTTIESFRDFVLGASKQLKTSNGGKGKALSYTMIPLSSFRKMAELSFKYEVVVKVIDESFLTSMVFFFEEVGKVKQKLNDLIADMADMSKYVNEKDLKTARTHQGDLARKESELKVLVLEDWVDVKSGKKELKELIKKVERFKMRELNLSLYEEYLESSSVTVGKMASVRLYLSKGVIYLGRGDTFLDVLTERLSQEFLVLLLTPQREGDDAGVRTSICHFFLNEAANPKQDTSYVVVDFNFQKERRFLGRDVGGVKCVHLKGSTVLSWDAYGDYVAEQQSSFVRLRAGADTETLSHKPGNRVPLEMICPSRCSQQSLPWLCFHCKATVEYGFDERFYCCCGGHRIGDFEYRCSDRKHSSAFVPGKADFIGKALSALRPFPELNILVIGQSGVGKSTWINAIVNYLNYKTLNEAEECGVICTIPTSFPMQDAKTFEEHIIVIGENENENTTIGQSATQGAHTYSFLWENKFVRIIDTPGLGDVRGIEQDKENLMNIINHIGYLNELHAVCILLKASDNKLNVIFSYCLKALLSHLHKGITKNIVFCFTNARNSFYSPGPAYVLLKNLITELRVENLSLGRHNTFCLENEAFLFLCSLSYPEITHDPILVSSLTQSWELSRMETLRLFNTIGRFEPHELNATISLVTARSRILNLTKPIAEISKTIQINLAAIQRKKEVIRESDETVEELMKKVEFMEVYLESVPLNYPRTICTSPKCVEYVSFRSVDVKEIYYKTHCHERCYLENVEAATVNNAELRGCDAMGRDGLCKNCGCGWEKHMHLTYTQVRGERKMVDKKVKKNIDEKMSEKERVEVLVNELEAKVQKYTEEQELIIQTSVKFGLFLRNNAITVFNDSVAEYLKHLIKQEEEKPYKSPEEENLIQNLRNMLDHYNAEVRILLETMQKGEGARQEVSIDEVMELEQRLYKLELMGESIKKYSESGRYCGKRASEYGETPLKVSKPKSGKSSILSSVYKKLGSFI